jgi:hypothetical protein
MINSICALSLLQILTGLCVTRMVVAGKVTNKIVCLLCCPLFFVRTHLSYSQRLHAILTTFSAVFVQTFYPKYECKQWRLLIEFVNSITLLWKL